MCSDGGTDGPHDGDGRATIPDQALFWVALYLTSQRFGGLAEGGWWFDEGELVTDPEAYRVLGGTPRSYLTETEEDAYASALEPSLAPLNVGRPAKHASTSRGVYEIHVINAVSLPLMFAAARPQYE